MRDIAEQARQGREILKSNMRMDMKASEVIAFKEEYDAAVKAGDGDALMNLISNAFYMGVAVGTRNNERKRNK